MVDEVDLADAVGHALFFKNKQTNLVSVLE